jgi:hypothetical protein
MPYDTSSAAPGDSCYDTGKEADPIIEFEGELSKAAIYFRLQ